MIKTLLLALDGSKHSLKAADYASTIAACLKARVVIIHVLKGHELPEGFREFAKAEHILGTDMEILKQAADFLIKNAETRVRDAGVEAVETEVIEGPVARTIAARAEHHSADMIVIGSRGLGDIEGALRGGVSHRVEILAKCPVLTVK